MISETIIQKRIDRLYRTGENRIHSNRMFEDFAQGFPYALGNRMERDSFITVTPDNSNLKKLLRAKYHYNMSYELEQIVGRVIFSLMFFGFAYVYITPEYDTVLLNDGTPKEELISLSLGEIRGVVTRKSDNSLDFWSNNYTGKLSKHILKRECFISFDLKELGYSRNYFNRLSRRIDKCDTTSRSLDLINVEGYNFKDHLRRNTINELKLTRKIGWIFTSDNLSDSYILYRRIVLNKLRMVMLNYVMNKINDCLLSFLETNDESKIVFKYRDLDYDDLWEKYVVGKITTSELSKLIL